MHMFSSHAGVLRRNSPGFIGGLRDWFASARERRRIRRDVAAMSRLPPHLLRDMGLEPLAGPPEPQAQVFW